MRKIALVTGATRGIGKAIALALAREGFVVVVTGRTLEEGQGLHNAMGDVPVPGSIAATLAAIAEEGGAAWGCRLDLMDRASIDAAVEAVLARFGRIDVLVNNGLYQGPSLMQTIGDLDLEDGERAVLGNFVNQFYLSRSVVPVMIKQGGGRMIFMSTHSSVVPTEGGSGLFYTAPKAAFNLIPDYINFEHGNDGLSAFLIEPGFTMTDTLRAVMGDQAHVLGKGTEAHEADETARTVAWLATNAGALRFAGPTMINAPGFFEQHGIADD